MSVYLWGFRFSVLGLFTVALACVPEARAQKDLDVYLLIGQSNMSGRGVMIPADTLTAIQGALLFKDSLTWEPARNPLNRYSTLEAGSAANQVGPGFAFAMELHRRLPAKEFGLVVNARGGSAIASWLKPGKYYTDALTRARQGAKAGTLKGILWHQGESDKTDTGYVAKLKGLMDSLRKDLGMPNLPVIAGQIGQFDTSHAGFNARILKLPERLTQSAVVKSDSLLDKGDKLHFDRAGQLKLGERYAVAAWSLIYKGTLGLGNAKDAEAGPMRRVNSREKTGMDGGMGKREGSPVWSMDPGGGFTDTMGRRRQANSAGP
jgi:hypothetical protein